MHDHERWIKEGGDDPAYAQDSISSKPDTCVWTMNPTHPNNDWKSSCGEFHSSPYLDLDEVSDYCPFCGRPIETSDEE